MAPYKLPPFGGGDRHLLSQLPSRRLGDMFIGTKAAMGWCVVSTAVSLAHKKNMADVLAKVFNVYIWFIYGS